MMRPDSSPYASGPFPILFRHGKLSQLNEQKISVLARRLLSFYGPITNVRVPNRELRDNLARSISGMTTENLLQKELGPVKFRTWQVPQPPDDAWLEAGVPHDLA